jgi:hypothetical protein
MSNKHQMVENNYKQATRIIEAATLGQSGLDVNNPDKSYELRTLPGTYSGLNVVSILHTALQQIAPGNESGFDIQSEYDRALVLFGEEA